MVCLVSATLDLRVDLSGVEKESENKTQKQEHLPTLGLTTHSLILDDLQNHNLHSCVMNSCLPYCSVGMSNCVLV